MIPEEVAAGSLRVLSVVRDGTEENSDDRSHLDRDLWYNSRSAI
jgi:hypothetical protein